MRNGNAAERRPGEFSRARRGASWDERCSVLFEDLRKPARVMVARAYGGALSTEEVEDVYANAWASTLAALRGRERRMDDDELRSYLLTAVANHASKEMRRRSRRPTSELREAHAQTVCDSHQPSPEERVVGAELGSVTRDVLASLPPRRRAVILLRYGWGLEPGEICALVSNLSPRAYRKEITRGIGEMIERLRQVESGEWCRSREPIIRDYVAGVGAAESERQALQHIDHCRQCSELVARLQGHLHELGGAIAWTSVAGTLGERKLAISERLLGVFDRGRDAAQAAADRGEGMSEAALALGSGGGARGAGAAGAGALAKLAGLGAAGKGAVACLGAGVAATACVAAGVVVPVIGSGGERPEPAAPRPPPTVVERAAPLPAPTGDVALVIRSAVPRASGPATGGGDGAAAKDPVGAPAERLRTAPEGAPVASPAPTAPAEQQEFGLPAAAEGGGSASAAPAGASASSGGGGDPGGGASGADVAREFGP